uniref:Uncharacterized protein n=1 Tax=Corethron hystrix TaxID=216773 RepID=A0A7S1FMS2_9STRA|mmetsp:Transcript_14379/g.31471  ORF Transcript_14379/g.31471 Transcript_14379/m.31471 type:complete len:482 (+) Transcript_14379:286-1731(+)
MMFFPYYLDYYFEPEPDPYIDAFVLENGDEIERNPWKFYSSRFPLDTPKKLGPFFFQLLIKVNPWATLSHDQRTILISNILLPLAEDGQTSDLLHLLVARNLRLHTFINVNDTVVPRFAKMVHVMLQEKSNISASWYYLSSLTKFFAYTQEGRVLTILQHMKTPMLLLNKLESVQMAKGIMRTDQKRENILLHCLCLFSIHGSLSSWDEETHNRLLSCLRSFEWNPFPKDREAQMSIVARILATLDSREIRKMEVYIFQKFYFLRTQGEIEAFCPLIERLTSSPDFISSVVTHPFLVDGLLKFADVPQNNIHSSKPFFHDKHLWGVWNHLFEWMIDSDPSRFLKTSHLFEKNLGTIDQEYAEKRGFGKSYLALKLKVEQTLMDPTNIRYSQDSIRQYFQDGRSVHQTLHDLSNSTLSPHRIPRIGVFCWNDQVHTEDNRRLYAFQEAQVKSVPVKLTTLASINPRKLTTMNRGKSVRMRGM